MSRERPDGTRLEWTLVFPASDALPLCIEDVTPRDWRVPPDPATSAHGNGARGVTEVTVRTAEVAGAALAYADLFGTRPTARADGSTTFVVGGVRVSLVEGAPEGAADITLHGVGAMPADIEMDGVRGDSAAGAGEPAGPTD
jgi:hypothetical protein